ncbi:bleomycin resistance protein [Gulosibacter sediminis]|uniref:bleomycin resistance protein n=1 Tax=Gulosibacter sediminis TaxID=1729695 RepID=UPI0024AC9F0C|nr:VOC family protein [Gulosibacter sediminis]
MSTPDFEPDLVPEILVSDVRASLDFWCGLCNFQVLYDRPEEGFAYIARGTAHLMLEERGRGRNWFTGELVQPFGRGINFQISVPEIDSILSALRDVGSALFMEPETKWYRVSDAEEAGVSQFLVMDPDGYLIRFQSSIGRRERAD